MKKISISVLALFCMSVMQFCSAGEVPKDPWRTLHVIPIVSVEVPTQCSRDNSRIEKVETRYYVLLSKNDAASYPNTNWDALVANRAAVQPTQIFGSTAIRGADREIDVFMKTVFNTLEKMTLSRKSGWFKSESLYTRKDYKYYYQSSYVIPPTHVGDEEACFTFVSLLGKKADHFLDQTTRTWMLQQVRLWSNGYKSEFKWVEIEKLMNISITPQAEAIKIDGMVINRSVLVALKDYWNIALAEFTKMDDTYRVRFNSQRVARYETDLNEQLAKQAGESWLSFAQAIYFNDDTPTYGAFGLNHKAIFKVGEGRYNSLQQVRVDNLGTESIEKINAAEDLRLVYDALKAKIASNQLLKDLLRNTGTLPLIYANRVNKNDRFYGIGSDARGENHLGRMLMTIRTNVDKPPTKYNPAVDYSLAMLTNPSQKSGLVAAQQASLATATANLLWYRATGRLPSSAKLTTAGGTRTLVKPSAIQTEPVSVSKAEQREEPQTTAGLQRRIVKTIEEQSSAVSQPAETTVPQPTPEQMKQEAEKQAIMKRMREATLGKPEK